MIRYFFNPEHDYALANNDANFVAPRSAVEFAADCADFMNIFTADNESGIEDITSVEPWGWDRAVKKRLQKEGIPDALLPSDSELDKIRFLAHRQTSSEAMSFIKNHYSPIYVDKSHIYLQPSVGLTSVSETVDYINALSSQNRSTIIKSPYSGNGKGIICVNQKINDTMTRKFSNILSRQGMLLAEPDHQVVQDFAMEFQCKQKKSEFCGYSLFQTDRFSYSFNFLLSDSEIEKWLEQWIDISVMNDIRKLIIEFIDTKIAPHYEGFLGVDMFIFLEEGRFMLHPMVEINLRYTMGLAARKLFDNKIHSKSNGKLRILHSESAGFLQAFASKQAGLYPPSCIKGKWSKGFFILTPISYNTKYSVVAALETIS